MKKKKLLIKCGVIMEEFLQNICTLKNLEKKLNYIKANLEKFEKLKEKKKPIFIFFRTFC